MTASIINRFVFGAGHLEPEKIERDIEQIDYRRRNGDDGPRGCRRPSLYVEIFEDMVSTVRDSEPHLLTEDEWRMLLQFSSLCYNARYCLIRLLFRKRGQWYSLLSMEPYQKEVGEKGLNLAIADLCKPLTEVADAEAIVFKVEVKQEENEVIDLTLDSDDEEETKPPLDYHAEAGPSTSVLDTSTSPSEDLSNPLQPRHDLNLEFFCQDETSMTLEQLLWRLNNDQLKQLTKCTKAQPRSLRKRDVISALLSHAVTQSVLDCALTPKDRTHPEAHHDGFRQTTLPFTPVRRTSQKNQEPRLREMALKMLGKCVRVNPDFHELVARLNIVYDRCLEYPKSLLLPALLTSFKKRVYPEYPYKRHSDIWSGRDEFLDYVDALKLDAYIEAEFGDNSPPKPRTKTPLPLPNRVNDPATPANHPATPLKTPKVALEDTVFVTPVGPKTEPVQDCKGEDAPEDEPPVEVPPKIEKARQIKDIFITTVFPKWQELLERKRAEGPTSRTPGLERFEPGYVYTSMFSKAMRAFATLGEYKAEFEAVEALLSQRLWRRGKRAKWYERRAILQTRYLCRLEGEVKESILQQAMTGVREALEDPDTGIVFRPGFVRRLRALEKRLKVPDEERCICEGVLRTADSITFNAERVFTRSTALKLDKSGVPVDCKENSPSHPNGLRAYFSPAATKTGGEPSPVTTVEPPNSSDKWKWKGKSVWRGKDKEEVTVEIRALQHYEAWGYKGFHSETRVLTTIFALLFWDIIFADIRGAFETPYQTAPLDLVEDSFYHARKDLIETRLEEIKSGSARQILEQHDEKHRKCNTWCVGVRWDICEKQDLVEIVECLGGETLCIVCRLFCEDYAGRSSGVPDLVVWDTTKCICKFVEVKGPGDRPQENQKLWFDSLLNAGAAVEICHVRDANQKTTAPATRGRKRKAVRGSSSKPRSSTKTRRDQEQDQPPMSDVESEDEMAADPTSLRRAPPRKRRRIDHDDEELPIFSSTGTPLASPSTSRAPVKHHDAVSSSKKRGFGRPTSPEWTNL